MRYNQKQQISRTIIHKLNNCLNKQYNTKLKPHNQTFDHIYLNPGNGPKRNTVAFTQNVISLYQRRRTHAHADITY